MVFHVLDRFWFLVVNLYLGIYESLNMFEFTHSFNFSAIRIDVSRLVRDILAI
jgi:hypothetical protein